MLRSALEECASVVECWVEGVPESRLAVSLDERALASLWDAVESAHPPLLLISRGLWMD